MVECSSSTAGGRSPARDIGLFGGTFDPVHYGHLRPAVEMAEHYELSTLYLLPNHRPAHRGPTAASTDSRIDMLEMAVQRSPTSGSGCPGGPARHTQLHVRHPAAKSMLEQPDATLLFFMGMDAFAAFDTWHDWEGILKLANLVIVNRPGAAHSDFSAALVERQRASLRPAYRQRRYRCHRILRCYPDGHLGHGCSASHCQRSIRAFFATGAGTGVY